jgi:hypothetical protein
MGWKSGIVLDADREGNESGRPCAVMSRIALGRLRCGDSPTTHQQHLINIRLVPSNSASQHEK